MIWDLAGMIGVEPWRLTLRRLVQMQKARAISDWHHTSSIYSIIHNVNCKPGSAKPPIAFHPILSQQDDAIKMSAKDAMPLISQMLVPRS